MSLVFTQASSAWLTAYCVNNAPFTSTVIINAAWQHALTFFHRCQDHKAFKKASGGASFTFMTCDVL
jgi:hypothetical protein